MTSQKGFTLMELVFVAGLITTITAIALPQMLVGLDESRTYAAARYMSGRLHAARMEAVTLTSNTALRFVRIGESYAFAVHVDGNRNGVRTSDIQNGVDRRLHPQELLSDRFPGVDFGALPGLPAVDPASPAPGDDPVRFGPSNMVAFTALGTSTPGSLYIRGRRDVQFVVRVFGDTGKIRVLKFNPRSRQWKQL
jgi:type II secretory pathway pseudopilin PulG